MVKKFNRREATKQTNKQKTEKEKEEEDRERNEQKKEKPISEWHFLRDIGRKRQVFCLGFMLTI